MVGTLVEFDDYIAADSLAQEIGMRYNEWNNLRQNKLTEWKELRNYLYATSTATTSNKILPWSNTTTTPKLTQLADNLHANYMASLFPQMNWMRWKPYNSDSSKKEKVTAVTSYMRDKIDKSGFVATVNQLVYDWITYGNCFAKVEYEDNFTVKEDGEYTEQYVGPKLVRISPFDIVFNPTAAEFKRSPKIIRSIITMGEFKRKSLNDASGKYNEVLDKMHYARAGVRGGGLSYEKSEGYVADGFGSIEQYYDSEYVEVLTLYGDIYDAASQEYKQDRIISVIDRAYILEDIENPSWHGSAPIHMAGWRKRPDNLYAMGPLDNLVGMQYRIDHLENLKADVFDQIAYPVLKIRGDVEEFDYAPGERIYLGEEGDVSSLVPDATALNADFQIQTIENKMEELAGAPRQAMGIRTPGEKTAFEVQSLDNSSGRMFQHKTSQFEMDFVEQVLNDMLEAARRNIRTEDVIAIVDEATGAQAFTSITKEDLVGSGRITAVGARHFAERARRTQMLQQLMMLKQDPSVGVHLSGKMIAKMLADELGESELYSENIAVSEQLETQTAGQNAEVANEENLMDQAEAGI